MLQLPGRGMARSVSHHNGDLSSQADWVEASVLFAGDTVSRSDVVDALIEGQVYRDQSFASDWVGILFDEVSRRSSLLGSAGALTREGNRIRRIRPWTDRPAYAFCVTLAIIPLYRSVIEKSLGKKYAQQGELFERFCVESLRASDWSVEPVAWSRSAANSIEAKVAALAGAIGETSLPNAIAKWTDPDAKDAGLDLVAWLPYPDGQGGRPVCLIQCASGDDWEDKLHTPNLNTWMKLVDFSTKPRKGLAMPFAPDADTFRLRANADLLMLLMDRHRLLSPGRGTPLILSAGLAKDLTKWTKDRVEVLPDDAH